MPNSQKAHPRVTTRHLSHNVKIHPGVRPGRHCEKNYNQDRTGQDNKKVVILGVSSPLRYCKEIWHSGRCPRGSYVGIIWSLKFKGCKILQGVKILASPLTLHVGLTQCSATALPIMAWPKWTQLRSIFSGSLYPNISVLMWKFCTVLWVSAGYIKHSQPQGQSLL